MIATTISSRPLRKVSYSNGKNVMPFSYMTFFMSHLVGIIYAVENGKTALRMIFLDYG